MGRSRESTIERPLAFAMAGYTCRPRLNFPRVHASREASGVPAREGLGKNSHEVSCANPGSDSGGKRSPKRQVISMAQARAATCRPAVSQYPHQHHRRHQRRCPRDLRLAACA